MLSKTARASRKGQNALGMFQKAHDQLGKAIDLADEAASAHDAKASHHSVRAQEARSLRDSHRQAQKKLSEFLP